MPGSGAGGSSIEGIAGNGGEAFPDDEDLPGGPVVGDLIVLAREVWEPFLPGLLPVPSEVTEFALDPFFFEKRPITTYLYCFVRFVSSDNIPEKGGKKEKKGGGAQTVIVYIPVGRVGDVKWEY